MREPTTHPDALDHATRPVARAVVLLVLVAAVASQCGCTGVAAMGGIAKLLTTWDVICPAGREVILAAAAVARPDDAGPSPGAPADASTSADNDGGTNP